MRNDTYKPSLRRQRIRLLVDKFQAQGVHLWPGQLDPIKAGSYTTYSSIDWHSKCHMVQLNGYVVHIPLDYYYQQDQEWLADSIVTEYMLSNYPSIKMPYQPWWAPAGLSAQTIYKNKCGWVDIESMI